MAVEQKELNLFPETSRSERPHLPVLDTQEMIDHMPEGNWQIPDEPYTLLERIRETDHPFMQDYKIGSFQGQCREIVADWIPFLDRAEKGYEITLRVIKEHILTPDLDSIQSFNYFYRVFKPKFKEDESSEFQKTVASVRNAFLYLLTEEQAGELGHEKPGQISNEDVENAKHLVEWMVRDVKVNL